MNPNPLGVASLIHALIALHEVSLIALLFEHAACSYNFRKVSGVD